MRRPSNDLPLVYVCRDIVDFRKVFKFLSVLVEGIPALDEVISLTDQQLQWLLSEAASTNMDVHIHALGERAIFSGEVIYRR